MEIEWVEWEEEEMTYDEFEFEKCLSVENDFDFRFVSENY